MGMAQRNPVVAYLILLLTTGVSAIILYLYHEPLCDVASLALLCFVAAALCGFHIAHPCCWFSAAYFMYSASYPILIIINPNHHLASCGYSSETMLLQWIGLVVFLFFSLTAKPKPKEIKWQFMYEFSRINWFIKTMGIAIICVFVIATQVYDSKADIVANLFFATFYRVSLLLTFITTFKIIVLLNTRQFSEISIKKRVMATFLFGLVVALVVASTGERSFLFRFIVVITIAFSAVNILRPRHLLVLAPLFASLFILSLYFKHFFVMGLVSAPSDTQKYFVEQLFSTEFSTGGRNLQVLINNEEITKGVWGLQQLLLDFIPIKLGSEAPNIGEWFQYDIIKSYVTGPGFTLVGHGYVCAGILGIVVVFFIYAIIIRLLYTASTKNPYLFSAYAYIITSTMYAMRQGVHVLPSQFIKQVVLMLVITYFMMSSIKTTKINLRGITAGHKASLH